MAKSPKDKNSLPQGKAGQSKLGAKADAPLVGSSHCCAGWNGPGSGIQVCVPTGLGGFVCQFVQSPPVAGAHVLAIEGGVIYWKNLVPNPIPEAVPDGDEPPWRTVKRVSRRPKKRGKGK